ncbi:DUF3592 domain-containing protein [Thalassotalea euphylliae]|uniref:DUF3592 domain-containing protein n=1 Tax=Thalassotalea euphylliae TaxID=1655234 RepID=A0A3E0TRS6_9GAMM|nr:DUF3592 domain-containing protein [Thalassotalea euphylliae]REL27060.1 DUF3592 domain-containing protein [Thalassotalea euphylliae]
METSEDFYIKFIFSAAVNVGIIAFVLFAIFDFRKRLWAKTDALITKSEVRTYKDSDDSDTFEPDIEYEYVFNGKKYKSNTIGFGISGTGTRKPAEELLGEFALNWKVRVFVNPKDPSQSTLKPGLGYHHLGAMGFLDPVTHFV